jgi:hypothetical protein
MSVRKPITEPFDVVTNFFSLFFHKSANEKYKSIACSKKNCPISDKITNLARILSDNKKLQTSHKVLDNKYI